MRYLNQLLHVICVAGLALSLSQCTDRQPKPVKETKKTPPVTDDTNPSNNPYKDPFSDPSAKSDQDPVDPNAVGVPTPTPTPMTQPGTPQQPGNPSGSNPTGPDEIKVVLSNGETKIIKWNAKEDMDATNTHSIQTH